MGLPEPGLFGKISFFCRNDYCIGPRNDLTIEFTQLKMKSEESEETSFIHSSDSNDSKKTNRPVHNIGQACKFCKRRHIKCDGSYPCSQCVKRGVECTFGAKAKRGPKPKTDLYDHCNKLMVDLEVQKQIAEYWKEQFLTAISKHQGKDHLNIAYDIEDPSFTSSDYETSSDALKPSNSGMNITMGDNINVDGMGFELNITNETPPEYTMSKTKLTNAFNLFIDCIQPIVPDYVFYPNIELGLVAWSSSQSDAEMTDDNHLLSALFEHSVAASFGFQLQLDAEAMNKYSKKAEDYLQLLFFQKEAQCDPQLSQKLVQLLILLSYFYASDDREGSKQSVIMLAYQIISMHRTHIAPDTMHRVYYIMMSLSETQVDRQYWYNQATSIAVQMKIKSSLALSSSTLIYVFSSLHPKGNFDTILTSFSRSEILDFLSKIDEAEKVAYSQTFNPKKPPIVLERSIRVFLAGLRSELYYMMGDIAKAQMEVENMISLAKQSSCAGHLFLLGLQSGLETAVYLNLTDVVHQGLEILDIFRVTYSIGNKYKHRLLSMINSNVISITNDVVDQTSNNVYPSGMDDNLIINYPPDDDKKEMSITNQYNQYAPYQTIELPPLFDNSFQPVTNNENTSLDELLLLEEDLDQYSMFS